MYSPRTGEKIGRRDACLLIFGFIQLMIGLSIFIIPPMPHIPRTIPVLERIMPAPVWGAIWIALGLVVMMSAFELTGRQRIGCMLAYLTPVFWAAAWLISFTLGLAPFGWVAAVIYIGYAGLALVISGWEEPIKGPPLGTFGERAP